MAGPFFMTTDALVTLFFYFTAWAAAMISIAAIFLISYLKEKVPRGSIFNYFYYGLGFLAASNVSYAFYLIFPELGTTTFQTLTLRNIQAVFNLLSALSFGYGFYKYYSVLQVEGSTEAPETDEEIVLQVIKTLAEKIEQTAGKEKVKEIIDTVSEDHPLLSAVYSGEVFDETQFKANFKEHKEDRVAGSNALIEQYSEFLSSLIGQEETRKIVDKVMSGNVSPELRKNLLSGFFAKKHLSGFDKFDTDFGGFKSGSIVIALGSSTSDRNVFVKQFLKSSFLSGKNAVLMTSKPAESFYEELKNNERAPLIVDLYSSKLEPVENFADFRGDKLVAESSMQGIDIALSKVFQTQGIKPYMIGGDFLIPILRKEKLDSVFLFSENLFAKIREKKAVAVLELDDQMFDSETISTFEELSDYVVKFEKNKINFIKGERKEYEYRLEDNELV